MHCFIQVNARLLKMAGQAGPRHMGNIRGRMNDFHERRGRNKFEIEKPPMNMNRDRGG